MDKRITKLSRDPFYVGLADRPISMYVDSDTGDVFIDEGAGKGRMNGAGLFADKGTRFLCEPREHGSVIKIACGTFIWEAGWTDDAADAASWVAGVNAFLATKRDLAQANGHAAPQARVENALG